jgi:hypothetical protein
MQTLSNVYRWHTQKRIEDMFNKKNPYKNGSIVFNFHAFTTQLSVSAHFKLQYIKQHVFAFYLLLNGI